MQEFKKDDWRIMIVDDTPQNLKLLENMLTKRGYQVFALPNGEMALKAAMRNPPDLMLLDINMPGMDGYEVCRRMKDNPELSSVPVIFLSALSDISDKIDAFKIGGVDYITKPFQFEEVNARVKTHLQIHHLQNALKASNQDLEEKVAARTAQLAESNEHLKNLDSVKNDFLSMICHEIRTPVNGILGLGTLAFDMCPDSKEVEQLKETYKKSQQRMGELLDDSLLLSSLENSELEADTTLLSACELTTQISKQLTYKLNINCSDDAAKTTVKGGNILQRALKTLLRLAVCFSKSEDSIKGDVFVKENFVHIKLELDRLNLSIEQTASFFDITSTIRSSSYAEHLGLAPVVAERIISFLNGDINLINTDLEMGYLEIIIPIAN